MFSKERESREKEEREVQATGYGLNVTWRPNSDLCVAYMWRNIDPCPAPTIVIAGHELAGCLTSGVHSFLMGVGKWLFPFAVSLRMRVYKEIITSQTADVCSGLFGGCLQFGMHSHISVFRSCQGAVKPAVNSKESKFQILCSFKVGFCGSI